MKEKIKKIVDPIGEIIKWFVGLCFIAGAFILFVYIVEVKVKGRIFPAWWYFKVILIILVATPIVFALVVLIFSFVIGSFTSIGKIGRKEKGGNADDDSSDDMG